jgi:hypothetical protein
MICKLVGEPCRDYAVIGARPLQKVAGHASLVPRETETETEREILLRVSKIAPVCSRN